MFYVFDPEHPAVRLPIGARPRFVGRGAVNDLVLDHPRVSGRHLSVWTEDGAVCVTDLGSSNGTTVDGDPVHGVVRRAPPFVIQLGDGPRLEVAAGEETSAPPAWRLREVASGVAVAVVTDRFCLGRDVLVPDAAESEHVQLLIDADGALWVARGDDAEIVAAGAILDVGATRWRVERVEGGVAPTELVQRKVYPYSARIEAAAVVVSHGDRACRIDAPNRFALMVVLARARARELAGAGSGWVSDEALAVGVWGAAERARDPRLVLCRARADLRDAGLDPWCLEKRASGTRLRVERVEG